ncbi:monoacylglycerol lipase ABHD2-like [Argonauta hians]
MSILLGVFLLCLLYGLIRLLNFCSPSFSPQLYYDRSSPFVQNILESCSLLRQPYIPLLLWGKNGHLQTLVCGVRGRNKDVDNWKERRQLKMEDGATLTYDVFQPIRNHPHGDFTIVVCPGHGSNSDSCYVGSFVSHAQSQGYRVVIQNHLGTLKDVKLTSPRVFNYGDTNDFHSITLEIQKLYPETKMCLVGFSMGANIVLKYLGENCDNQNRFLCGLSICQGYDANLAVSHYFDTISTCSAYVLLLTTRQKSLLWEHKDILFSDEAKNKYGALDEHRIFNSPTLLEIDEYYSRRVAGFTSVQEYYRWCSSIHYLDNIKIPLLLLNAADDPLVPQDLLRIPKAHAMNNEKCIMAVTTHGGHLGYLEGGGLFPNEISWSDKLIVQYLDTIISQHMTTTTQQLPPQQHNT